MSRVSQVADFNEVLSAVCLVHVLFLRAWFFQISRTYVRVVVHI